MMSDFVDMTPGAGVAEVRLVLAHAGRRRFHRTRWTEHCVQHWVLDSVVRGRQSQRVGDGAVFERFGGLLALYAPGTLYFEHEVAGRELGEAYMVFSATGEIEALLRRLTAPPGYAHIQDPRALVSTVLHKVARDARFGGFGMALQVTGHMLHALGLLAMSVPLSASLRRLCPESDPTQSLVARISLHIAEHVAEPLTVADLAAAVGMSESAFAHAYPRAAGETPYHAIVRGKIAAAKRMLLSNRLTVQETAARLGFSSPFNFSRAFKRVEGCAPSHYVARHSQ